MDDNHQSSSSYFFLSSNHSIPISRSPYFIHISSQCLGSTYVWWILFLFAILQINGNSFTNYIRHIHIHTFDILFSHLFAVLRIVSSIYSRDGMSKCTIFEQITQPTPIQPPSLHVPVLSKTALLLFILCISAKTCMCTLYNNTRECGELLHLSNHAT